MINKSVLLIIYVFTINCKSTVLPKTILDDFDTGNETTGVEYKDLESEDIEYDDMDSGETITEVPEGRHWNCSILSHNLTRCEILKLDAAYPFFEKIEPSKTPMPRLPESYVNKWITKMEGSLSDWLMKMQKVFANEINN